MKKLRIILFLLMTLGLLVIGLGCGSGNTMAVPTDKTIEPTVDLKASIYDDGFRFEISSNLPDATQLMVSLEDKDGNILNQHEISLQSGVANAGPFRHGDQRWPAGDYNVNVTVPIISGQPDSVKSVLGENGENLRGPLVEDAFDSKIVTKTFSFTSTK